MESKLAKVGAVLGILGSLAGIGTWVSSNIATKSDIEDVKNQIVLNALELSIVQAEDSLYVLDLAVDGGRELSATEARRYATLQSRIARLTAEKEKRINQ